MKVDKANYKSTTLAGLEFRQFYRNIPVSSFPTDPEKNYLRLKLFLACYIKIVIILFDPEVSFCEYYFLSNWHFAVWTQLVIYSTTINQYIPLLSVHFVEYYKRYQGKVKADHRSDIYYNWMKSGNCDATQMSFLEHLLWLYGQSRVLIVQQNIFNSFS